MDFEVCAPAKYSGHFLDICLDNYEDIIIISDSTRMAEDHNGFAINGRACFIRTSKDPLIKPQIFSIN